MPVPRTRDVSKLISFFNREHPEWSKYKIVAAAINSARRAGKRIPKKRKLK